MNQPPSKLKIAVFSLVPLIALALVLELALRVVYFQSNARQPLALLSLYQSVRLKFINYRAQRIYQDTAGNRDKTRYLYEKEGAPLLADFKRRYEESFKRIADECARLDVKLLVLYAPGDDYRKSPILADTVKFYGGLAGKYGLEFVDMTPAFLAHDPKTVTLLPQNGHLSRFGNELVAAELSRRLKPLASHRSKASFENKPKLLGDLAPGQDRVWMDLPEIPYRVVTNRQGFRMAKDLEVPKKRQRVLLLGDSITFGPYLPDSHTFSYLLQDLMPSAEIINAGVSGYTITDEEGLFFERARYADPDIVVLQVLDNDLYGLFSHMLSIYNRKRESHAPTQAELDFLARVKDLP